MVYSSQAHGAVPSKEVEYLEGWQRERAEFQNYRKRLAAEQQDTSTRAQMTAVASLLGLADNFQAIVRHIPTELQNHSWAQGVLHVARQFESILQGYGVAPITETGIPFDPSVHEAVEKVAKKETPSGLVVEVIQPGYKVGESVLKPARVKVSA